MNPELTKKCIDAIRFLSVDAVEKANSGHPGMPMGAAPMAFVLFAGHMRFNPKEPRWANRDRFILSAGHGSMLLYAMLHLTGYDVTIDDLKAFRQWGSKTPGHPEFHDTPGVEATTGPLGQGISNAVGFALSQRMLAARLNQGGTFPIDNFIYAICSDGDLMEGVSAEACSLAGHLKLGNLVCLYDDNQVSLAGHTDVTFSDDTGKRFAAYGWHTQRVADGNDVDAIDRAIQAAKEDPRPSLISVRTVLGYGSPHKANTHEAHGSPLGKDEVKATKLNLGWPLEPTFLVPDEVRRFWAGRIEELKKGYEEWQRKFVEWQRQSPQKAKLWSQLANRETPADLADQLVSVVKADAPEATRKHGQAVLQKAAQLVPNLVGGSADLDPSTFTYVKDGGDVAPESYRGRNIHFGVREHGMGAIANGFAYDGFFIPYTATFLLFSDYMRPPIRLAALSKLQTIFVFTHDSIFLGEDGPTHQPIEHLAALRAIPNVELWRPADGIETAAAWAAAIGRTEGPSIFAFSRQKLPPLQRATKSDVRQALRGAYALNEVSDPEVVLVATGSEVSLAQQALPLLQGRKVRLVSMPCVERFLKWDGDEQRELVPHGKAKIVAIEAAGGLDWYRIVGDGLVVGIDRFGASAPEKALADAYDLTPQKVAGRIAKWLDQGARANTK